MIGVDFDSKLLVSLASFVKFLRMTTPQPCQYKLTQSTDCCGCYIKPDSICNVVFNDEQRSRFCRRYDRIGELDRSEHKPSCCFEFEALYYKCAEDSGSMKGCFDIRKYPNDGKDVWRNYERVSFLFCPFCGESRK